jgi:ketosteroid isomerase-like protein
MSEGGATIVVGGEGRDEGDLRGAAAAARGFAAALLARDAEGAATYLAVDSCILTPDGTEVVGRSAVWEVLAQISASGQELEIRLGRTVARGDVALSTQFWRRRSVGEAGGFDKSTVTRLVLSRDAGRWSIAIASPWDQ